MRKGSGAQNVRGVTRGNVEYGVEQYRIGKNARNYFKNNSAARQKCNNLLIIIYNTINVKSEN